MFKFKKTGASNISKPKNKNKSILMTAAVVGLIAAGGIYYAFMGIYVPVNVVVAVKDITTQTKITQADVTVKKMSKRDAHPQSLTSLKSVVGSYPRMPITAGEPILKTKVVNNIGTLLDTYESLQADEMLIELKANKNVSFPKVLKDGDYVTFVVVKDEGTVEVGKGSKYLSGSGPNIINNFNNLSAGKDPTEGRLLVICKREEGKKVLEATLKSKLVYVMPEHPDNLIITPGKNVAVPK